MKGFPFGVTLVFVTSLQAFQAFSFPAPAAGRSILPSAACFILDGQVHRLARNGETLTRVSGETLPVESFDVSPATGDIVLVEDPSYFVYLGILQSHGVQARGVRMEKDGLDLESLEAVLKALK